MKHLKIALLSLSLIGCHANMGEERKKNALYLVEGDRIILACEKYKCAHGIYPPELKDLDPKVWKESSIDLQNDPNVRMSYSGISGLTLRIGSVQYIFDLWDQSKGWQESDQSF